MGGGKKSKAPAAPDYSGIAQQQADSSYKIAKDVTAWNRPNQYDALGNSLTWTQSTGNNTAAQKAAQAEVDKWKKYVSDMSIPESQRQSVLDNQLKQAREKLSNLGGGGTTWEQRVTASPEVLKNLQQYLANSTAARDYQAKQMAAAQAQGKFDPSQFKTKVGAQPTYSEANGKAVSDAIYKSIADRTAPQQQKDMAAMQSQLRQQGLQPGTEAYDRAIRNLMTSQGDVMAQAANQATIGGYDEARQRYLAQLQGSDQNFNQNLQSNSANFGQALSAYNQPYQNAAAMAAMAGGAQQPTFSGFSGATGYNPTDMLGAANAGYQAQMGGYNSGNAKKGSTLGAGLGFAGSLLGGK